MCHILSGLEVALLYRFPPPITQIESSTNPMILNDTTMFPLGLAVVSPCAFCLWQLNNILEMKHHIIGEFPDPCPVP